MSERLYITYFDAATSKDVGHVTLMSPFDGDNAPMPDRLARDHMPDHVAELMDSTTIQWDLRVKSVRDVNRELLRSGVRRGWISPETGEWLELGKSNPFRPRNRRKRTRLRKTLTGVAVAGAVIAILILIF
tara:strand:+ start:582 stop:974 length:393 start_codon:yes stop_codon:yes gene_type:complete